ncbi:MAG TPA: hypothetical protein VFW11_09220 [Cyclobacteriaceae bacterium]|nr:hypothetical protein [Cyclobacteriaceae bacterium]
MNLTVSDGFPYYISLVEEADVKLAFHSSKNFALLSTITNDKANYRYAPGKWSIKQIIGMSRIMSAS